jgi:archaellum biogenesis ATPase FlaH
LPDSRNTVGARQSVVDELHAEIFAERIARRAKSNGADGHAQASLNLDDAKVIEIASRAKNGDAFKGLYYAGAYIGDHSSADFALLCTLYFYTGDIAQAARIFETSALGQRDKWTGRPDYRERTLEAVRETVTKFYTPRGHAYQRKAGQQGADDNASKSEANATTDNQNGVVHRAKVVRMNTVEAEKIQWLWKSHIALGKISLLGGDPGKGKSIAAIDLAARTSVGDTWPDDAEASDAGSVLILSAEDGIEDTIKPRLDRAGADTAKVICLKAIEVYQDGKLQMERGFSLTEDIKRLSEILTQERDIRLIIIDPLSAYIGNTDANKDVQVRDALTPLVALAEEFNVAILVILHLNKAAVQAIYRVSGSVAFTAIARAVFVIADHPRDKNDRLFISLKNNLAPTASPRVFHIDPSDTDNDQRIKVVWRGSSDLTVDEIFNVTPGRKPQGEDGKARLNEAKEFLREFLAGGAKLADDVKDAAKARDIAIKSTLRRAREELGIEPRKEPERFAGQWFWQLPAQTPNR